MADWVAELGLEPVELLDTGLNPVTIVAAAPEALLDADQLPKRRVLVASEYETLTRSWIKNRGIDADFVRTYGATEVFPPEDADVIVDNTATGSTLRANGLKVFDQLMTSSTRLYGSPKALDDKAKRNRIEDLVLVIRAVLEARQRAMLTANVAANRLSELLEVLPAMRQATVATLANEAGYSVTVAVPRSELTAIIPLVRAKGGSDIVVSQPAQIVP